MEVFTILVVMYWPNILDRPATDSVMAEFYNGKRLEFSSYDSCYNHVQENLEALKQFGKSNFPDAELVKKILCVRQSGFST